MVFLTPERERALKSWGVWTSIALCTGAIMFVVGTCTGCEALQDSETVQAVGAAIESEQAKSIAATVDTVGGMVGLPAFASSALEILGALWAVLGLKKGAQAGVAKLKKSEKGKLIG